jgi:serine/threonine protein kinase
VNAGTIGPFRVIEPLGHGSMGEISLVEDTRTGAHRVLKEASEEWLRLPGARRRLFEEARAAMNIRHPRVAAVHEVVEIGDRPILVLDYVEGEALDARLAREPITIERALVVAIDVAEAVAAAHAEGVVHHDLKPSRVRLGSDGRAVVLGFGVARVRPAASAQVLRSVATGVADVPRFTGTPGYAAPEQLTGRSTDRRSDLYSIGALLFEMLAGRRPFEDAEAAGVALATLTEPVPPVRRFNAAVPAVLDAIVTRALAKNPGDRFQSATELADELKQALRALGARPAVSLDEQWAVANPTAAGPATLASRRVVIGIAVIVALAAFVALVWF